MFARILAILAVVSVFCACVTAKPVTFVSSTFQEKQGKLVFLGPATGKSCQTLIFGFLPFGTVSSLSEAVDDARTKHPMTTFIADMSVDYLTTNGILFVTNCVTITGFSYRVDAENSPTTLPQ